MFHNWVDDQKHIWSFPARVTQHRNWIPTAAVLGATAGLFFFDNREAAYFRGTTTFHEFNHIVNGNADGFRHGRPFGLAVCRGADSQRFEDAAHGLAGG